MKRAEESRIKILAAWSAERVEESGKLHFFNSITGEKTWEFPEGVVIADEDMQWMFAREADRKEAERVRRQKEEEERRMAEAEMRREEKQAKEAQARKVREAAEAAARTQEAAIRVRK